MKLELTIEDLEGDYYSNFDCPIARALKRNGHENVLVGGFSVDYDEHKMIEIINCNEFEAFIELEEEGPFIIELGDT